MPSQRQPTQVGGVLSLPCRKSMVLPVVSSFTSLDRWPLPLSLLQISPLLCSCCTRKGLVRRMMPTYMRKPSPTSASALLFPRWTPISAMMAPTCPSISRKFEMSGDGGDFMELSLEVGVQGKFFPITHKRSTQAHPVGISTPLVLSKDGPHQLSSLTAQTGESMTPKPKPNGRKTTWTTRTSQTLLRRNISVPLILLQAWEVRGLGGRAPRWLL